MIEIKNSIVSLLCIYCLTLTVSRSVKCFDLNVANVINNASLANFTSRASSDLNGSNGSSIGINTANTSNTSDESKVCFEIGCYEGRRYNEANVPIGSQVLVVPDSIDQIDIKFNFFYRLETRAKQLRFNSSIDKLEGFDARKPTYFAVHGWREKYQNLGWMEFLKDRILTQLNGSANVFLVDWGSDSGNLFYPKPAANTRVVGDAIAFFAQALRNAFSISCEQINLIGFSLGAQASGYAGQRLRQKHNCLINSIHGLDPAGPYFREESGENRLDKDDARHVSVLHSNMASNVLQGFGNPLHSGKVDVFLNGGSIQPGCDKFDLAGEIVASGLNPASLSKIGCSHSRAEQFYRTDFDKLTKCQPVAYQCESYSEFQRGRCADCGPDNSKCHLVGFYPNYLPQMPQNQDEGFYLDTTNEVPYCVYHHQIRIHINPRSAAMTGALYMDLVGRTRDVQELKYERRLKNFVPGAPHTFLFKYNEPLGKVEQIRIYFKSSIKNRVIGVFRKNDRLLVDKIEFNYMSHIDPNVRRSLSTVLCPQSEADYLVSDDPNEKVIFKECPTDSPMINRNSTTSEGALNNRTNLY